jgi:hypothetical protein
MSLREGTQLRPVFSIYTSTPLLPPLLSLIVVSCLTTAGVDFIFTVIARRKKQQENNLPI